MSKKIKFKNLLFKKIMPLVLICCLIFSCFTLTASAHVFHRKNLNSVFADDLNDFFTQINVPNSNNVYFQSHSITYDNLLSSNFTESQLLFNFPPAYSLHTVYYEFGFSQQLLDWVYKGAGGVNTDKNEFLVEIPLTFIEVVDEKTKSTIGPYFAPSSIGGSIKEAGSNSYLEASQLTKYDFSVTKYEKFTETDFLIIDGKRKEDVYVREVQFFIKFYLDLDQLIIGAKTDFRLRLKMNCYSNGLSTDMLLGGLNNISHGGVIDGGGTLTFSAVTITPLFNFPNFDSDGDGFIDADNLFEDKLLFGWHGIVYTGDPVKDYDSVSDAIHYQFDDFVDEFKSIVNEFISGYSYARPIDGAITFFNMFFTEHNFNGLTILVYCSFIFGILSLVLGISHSLFGSAISTGKHVKRKFK